ncbi:hypothetical protein GCM10027168_70770 [Streptomyces capparidis]
MEKTPVRRHRSLGTCAPASDAVVTSRTPVVRSEVAAGSIVVVVTEDAGDESSDDGTPAGAKTVDDTATTSSSTTGGHGDLPTPDDTEPSTARARLRAR